MSIHLPTFEIVLKKYTSPRILRNNRGHVLADFVIFVHPLNSFYLPSAFVIMSNIEPIEDDMDDIDPSEMWTAEEREEYFREMDECPLLMSEYTEVGIGWCFA